MVIAIPISNNSIPLHVSTSAPVVGDDVSAGFGVPHMWYDSSSDKYYLLKDDSIGAALWEELSADQRSKIKFGGGEKYISWAS